MKALSPRRIGLSWPEPLLLWMQTLNFDHSCHNLSLTPSNESNRNRLKHGSCLAEVKMRVEWRNQRGKALLKVETRADSSDGRTGALGEAGQRNWLEWTVILSPVDNMSVSAGVMYHSLSVEALFWWFLYWETGRTAPAL